MKNWAELSVEEQGTIVKTFCELHESRKHTVSEIAAKSDISRETAGLLANLLHLHSSRPYAINKKKMNRVSCNEKIESK